MDAFERHVALTVERQLGDEGHTRKPDGTSTRHSCSASHPLPCQLPVPASPFPSLAFCFGRQVRPQCPGACACRGDGAPRGPCRATRGGAGRPTAHTRHAAVRTTLMCANRAGAWEWGMTLRAVLMMGVQEPAGAECEASGACAARRRRRTAQGTARPGIHKHVPTFSDQATPRPMA